MRPLACNLLMGRSPRRPPPDGRLAMTEKSKRIPFKTAFPGIDIQKSRSIFFIIKSSLINELLLKITHGHYERDYPARHLEQKTVKRVLIFYPGALGDLALSVPVLSALREGYPDVTLHLVGSLPQANLLRLWPPPKRPARHHRKPARLAQGRGPLLVARGPLVAQAQGLWQVRLNPNHQG